MSEAPAAPARPGRKTRSRLERGTLTREVIVEAALRILDEGQVNALTFARLGKELGASPTAMYRHFSSRDQIMTAVADELIRIAIDGYKPAESWMDSLRDLAYRAWHTFAQHPAAAMHTFYRVTLGPNEIRVVDSILEAIHEAGWRGHEAVFNYQMYANMVLALSGRNAAMLTAAAEAGTEPGSFWVQEYRPANPEDFPYLTALRNELRIRDGFAVFQGQIEALLTAMKAALPTSS